MPHNPTTSSSALKALPKDQRKPLLKLHSAVGDLGSPSKGEDEPYITALAEVATYKAARKQGVADTKKEEMKDYKEYKKWWDDAIAEGEGEGAERPWKFRVNRERKWNKKGRMESERLEWEERAWVREEEE